MFLSHSEINQKFKPFFLGGEKQYMVLKYMVDTNVT